MPIDGVIEEGRTSLNTSALTGESLPREAGVGDEVISGCINMSVSYTHLDVYKRQVLDWTDHIKKLGANAIYFSPVFESDTHGYNTRAVSYTHLDVYKRQL